MLIVVGVMLTGVLVGLLFRKYRMKWLSHVIMIFICLLLFLLGFEVGTNKRIITGLHELGLEALLIAIAGILGSCIASYLLWRWIVKNENSQK